MKKLVCAMLAFVMLLGCAAALAADSVTFEPSLTNAADQTAKSWFASSEKRALLTILLALDYTTENSDFDFGSVLSGTSYVAYDKEESTLVVEYCGDDKTYTFVYMPIIETASVSVAEEAYSELAVEMAFDAMGCEYHRNSLAKIVEVAEMLQDALGM